MSSQAQPAGRAGARELSAPRKTILVVDDEEALVRVLALLLEEEGYRVVTARNGRLALEAFRRDGVDLVVTDFMMPELDGRELIATLLEMRPRLPIVLMSSLDADIVNRACSGHMHFFRKPFDVPEFLRQIAHLTSGTGRDHLRVVK